MTPAPATGDVGALVRAALSDAATSGRTLVVYVGATWCEPCQYFHNAVDHGELGAALAGVTLLEFDLDRDRDRLEAAGYRSSYIPLFAVPGVDGRATGRQVEGGIKGDAAVGFMLPRLRELLGR
jgi:thiol-disulfide isomerase/thioredoxin